MKGTLASIGIAAALAVSATASDAATRGRPDRAAQTSEAQPESSPAGANLVLPPPTSTIHWSRTRDGQLVISDRPEPDAVEHGVQTFPGASSPEAMERARRERDYWRTQSDAFSERQRERDRLLEEARRARLAAEAAPMAVAPAEPAAWRFRRFERWNAPLPGWAFAPVAPPLVGVAPVAPPNAPPAHSRPARPARSSSGYYVGPR